MQYESPNPNVKSYLTQYNVAELEYVYRSISNSSNSIKLGECSYYIPNKNEPSELNQILALGEDIVRNFRYCIIMTKYKTLFILFNFDDKGNSISVPRLCEILESTDISVCSNTDINIKLHELFGLDNNCTWYSVYTVYSVYHGSNYKSTNTDTIMTVADIIYDKLIINKII